MDGNSGRGDVRAQVAFHLTGKHARRVPEDLAAGGFRPALLTGYRELAKLRHDYPLVLVAADDDDDGAAPVRSLSAIFDAIARRIAPPGTDGERLRTHVLRLEDEIRDLVLARGTGGTLSELWEQAADTLCASDDDKGAASLGDSFSRARDTLALDGAVIGCDRATPVAVVTHLWQTVQDDKARRLHGRLAELSARLGDILKADDLKSDRARTPEALKGSVGTAFEGTFDFDAMSGILADGGAPTGGISKARRGRIGAALALIEAQRFVAQVGPRRNGGARATPHAFVFDSVARALAAYRKRLPELVALVKAIAVAELEIANQYREAPHDPVFAEYDADALAAEDLEPFPDYLVCLDARRMEAAERGLLIEALATCGAMKILLCSDDILGAGPLGAGGLGWESWNTQLARMAVGLNTAYVLQSSASNLYQSRDRMLRGMTYRGAALFSIFSGAPEDGAGLPAYLMAAAAMQSRAFPSFIHDPGAGVDWAARFHVGDNPDPEADWTVTNFAYEGHDLQRMSEDIAFSFVDFVACDPRHADNFERVPPDQWHDAMIPAAAYLALDPEAAREMVPYVLMVDGDNGLHKFIVEGRVIDAARACLDAWHSLRELGGVANSHAQALLDRERATRAQEAEREIEKPAAAAEATEATEAEEAPAPPSDESYIETARCTTCNECTEINNKMFVYDDNQQAYIADIDAGTYRQLVDAAEACQVAIIHPGKPRNPDEPNLEALIARAEPFA
ncbi:MAG: hypothetical protein V3S44_06725 [Alphaproteobacteria bacterium]